MIQRLSPELLPGAGNISSVVEESSGECHCPKGGLLFLPLFPDQRGSPRLEDISPPGLHSPNSSAVPALEIVSKQWLTLFQGAQALLGFDPMPLPPGSKAALNSGQPCLKPAHHALNFGSAPGKG